MNSLYILQEEVVKDVNTWAESASRGLIKDILKPDHIREETKVLLANALYFKGTWKFDEKYTTDKYFHLLNGDKISVPFMTVCNEFTYGSFKGCQVVKIPYDIGKEVIQMIIKDKKVAWKECFSIGICLVFMFSLLVFQRFNLFD